jgi:hypothetical protein
MEPWKLFYDIQYFNCPRAAVNVPTTLSGVSAYASRRLAGFPSFSYTTCALPRVKISQSSELVMEASTGFRTSPSGVGILAIYSACRMVLTRGKTKTRRHATVVTVGEACRRALEVWIRVVIGGASAGGVNR